MTGFIIAYFIVAALVFLMGIVLWAMSRPFEDERRLTRTGARMVVGCLVWPWLFVVLVRTYAMTVVRDSRARLDEIMAPVRVDSTYVDVEPNDESAQGIDIDPELRRTVIKELADAALRETVDGIAGNVVPRTPFEAEQWLRAQLTPPDFPEIARRRSMDGSLTTESIKGHHDMLIQADPLPIDDLNKKLGW